VPLGWKLIGPQLQDEVIPRVPGDPFHRILARGELLATEQDPGHPPEAMMFRRYPLPGPPSAGILGQYVAGVFDTLTKQGVAARAVTQVILRCALSQHPCAKLVVEKQIKSGERMIEIHYLVSDSAGLSWLLVYLLRPDNLASWAPLLAEIEGSQAAVS
jgi:hypothetical protein